MNSVRPQVAKFQRHLLTQTLLDGSAPLLNILRWRLSLDSSEAHSGHTQNCGGEVEVSCDHASSRNEVIALLCFRKNKRHIVSLIAPGIHVDRREENAKRSM